MVARAMTARVNPWKVSTLVLTGVLIVGALGPTAEAAGPARLTKALAALRSGKKLLDEAKEPPAVPHAQSLVAVNAAIAAVEREIKAYEAAQAKARPAGSGATDAKAPAKKKDEKPKVDPGDSD